MASGTPKFEDYVDLLRLDEAQFLALLSTCKAFAGTNPRSIDGFSRGETREYRRLRANNCMWVPISLQESSGNTRKLRAYPIDICSGGMAVFLGMFVHVSTKISVTLTLPDGEHFMVNGVASNCRMISGRAHRLGVRFEKFFDMALVQESDRSVSISDPATSPSPLPVMPDPIDESGHTVGATRSLADDSSIATELAKLRAEVQQLQTIVSSLSNREPPSGTPSGQSPSGNEA